MKTPLKRIAMFIIVSALVALFGASCATTRGFGRDVGTVGDKIEESAR